MLFNLRQDEDVELELLVGLFRLSGSLLGQLVDDGARLRDEHLHAAFGPGNFIYLLT